MIPAGWKTERFADIADYKAGRTPARANPEYWRGAQDGVPWVAISDMTGFGTVTQTGEKITQTAFEQVFQAKMVSAGTLIMSFKLTIGRVATLGIDACHNEAIIAIYPKAGVEQRYLGYFLSQIDYNALQDRQVKGNTLNQDKIDRIKVWLPPHQEQVFISDVLDLIRCAIDLQDKELSSARALKCAAMTKLFARGLRGEAMKETVVGSVPGSWQLKDCEELVEYITVGVVVRPASYYVAHGVPAFRSFNVTEDRLDPSDLVYFSPEANDGPLRKSKLRAGDVLVVRTGYPGTSCVVPDEYDGANCIDIAIMRVKKKQIHPAFLSRFLNSVSGRTQSATAKHGLAQQHLNVGSLRRLKVPVPRDLAEQSEILSVLDAIDSKIDLHRRKREILEELFQSLLLKLMTGELPVAELDLSVLKTDGAAKAAA